ncbi:hypothetical protein FRC11_012266, partial [Ceratobasidium sp. 423]
QVSYSRNKFTKNTEDYTILKGFGNNLLVTEGDEWKRQRRIAAPAFSDKNNQLVWETAKGFSNQMINTWKDEEPTVVCDVSEDLSLPLSLCVIAKAGFGQDVFWGSDAVPLGHKLTFKDALSITSKTMHLPLILPNWAWGLRKSWRGAKQAHDELRLYLHEMIKVRRQLKEQQVQEFLDQKHDLFNQLIYARDADDMLTEDELIGGHETTAHTFAIMLGLLALYPDVQDKLVKQIHGLQKEYEDLSYSHINELTYAMAVVYETLRLYPMVAGLPKRATADTTIAIGLPPHSQTIQVSASTPVHVSSTGVHYNSSYWENPNDFDPERFMDPHWNRDAFIAFSLGPRACIGRRQAISDLITEGNTNPKIRFAETSLIAEVVALVSKYKISIDETRFKPLDGETILKQRERLINPEERLTLSPAPISLVFSPRN